MIDCILDQVWRQYEINNRCDLTIEQVAKSTKIHRDTIANLKNGKTSRYDADVIARVAEFFGAKEGEPVPFLVVRYMAGDEKHKATLK